MQHVARALSACTKRKSDMLARYGGEEFAAILPSTNATDAIAIAERMRAAIEALHIDHDGSSLRRLSISVGIAAVDADADVDPMTVVKRADEAVYVAKSRGRNRAVGPGYESASEPARQRHATRRNLPLQLTRFLGRERELADVQRLIREARLVTLAGPGGIGKTRLSIETGRTLLESFVDGVWLVDLASVDDPAQVASAFAAALEIEATEETPPAQLVTAALKNKNALLLLDNYEHLLDACAGLIDAVLAQAGNLHVLATSRQPLGLNGERVYRVNALDLPVSGAPSTLREAEAFDGIAFFIARARESVPAFVLSDARVPTVVRICRRLDGIPLAIELAAARLRTMSLEELAEQLDTGFSVLVAGRSGAPRRRNARGALCVEFRPAHRSGESRVYAPGRVCRNVVARGGDGGVLRRRRSRGGRARRARSLVDKSLVLLESHGTRNRYRFLESTREFARERLAESGESEAVRARFVGYYRALAERARAAPALQPTRLWLPPLIPEWDNFRSVLSACLIGGGDRVAGATIAVGLIPFWEATSKSADARVWLEAALVAEGLPDPLVAQLSSGRCVLFAHRQRGSGARRPAQPARARNRAFGLRRGRRLRCIGEPGRFVPDPEPHGGGPTAVRTSAGIGRRQGYRLAESDALNYLGTCADFAGDPVNRGATTKSRWRSRVRSDTTAGPRGPCTISACFPKLPATSTAPRATSARRWRSSSATAPRARS